MTIRCTICRGEIEVPVEPGQVEAWQESGALCQNYFPELTSDERELLISGTCPACWERLFSEEPEGDNV